jgi:hypothetical protein
MRELPPTFASNKDRVVYLLAEYRVPLSVMILAAGVWFSWARPEIPTPPQELVDVSIACMILALPVYGFGLHVSKYLFDPPGITVGVADPGTNGEDGEPSEYRVKRVPAQIWQDKTVTGANPLVPNEGVDFVVTRFNWYEDIRELEVRGCDQEDLPPGDAWENAKRVDEIYLYHHEIRRAYSQLKASVHRYATEIHDATMMTLLAEQEDARLAEGVSVNSLIEDMEDEVGDLPDGPESDHDPQHVRRWGMDEMDLHLLTEPDDNDEAMTMTNQKQPLRNDGGTEE